MDGMPNSYQKLVVMTSLSGTGEPMRLQQRETQKNGIMSMDCSVLAYT